MAEFDIDMGLFVERLFSAPPSPPFSYFISFGNIDIPNFLGNMVIIGADKLYSKELSNLSEPELSRLRDYLLSIGWDADYNPVCMYKEALDYHPNGKPYVLKIKVNNWQVTFKPANQNLRPDDRLLRDF
jgi:hypothetical protein